MTLREYIVTEATDEQIAELFDIMFPICEKCPLSFDCKCHSGQACKKYVEGRMNEVIT